MERLQNKIEQLIGKEVIVTVKSGAKYGGFLWRKGEDRIVLSSLKILQKNGNLYCASKSDKSRSFLLDNIRDIEKYDPSDYNKRYIKEVKNQ